MDSGAMDTVTMVHRPLLGFVTGHKRASVGGGGGGKVTRLLGTTLSKELYCANRVEKTWKPRRIGRESTDDQEFIR